MSFTNDEVQRILFDSVGKTLKRDPAELAPSMRWVEDLGFKSVQGMKVCGYLNYYLKVTVPLGTLIKCATLQDAVDMLTEMANEEQE